MSEKTDKKEDTMVTIIIDKDTGGLRTNGKLYVGKVTVPEHLAEDLMRRQEEYLATIKKLTDPSVELRNQSIETTRKAFMADPKVHGNNPRFSKVNGLTTNFQMSVVSEQDKEEWHQERMGLFGY